MKQVFNSKNQFESNRDDWSFYGHVWHVSKPPHLEIDLSILNNKLFWKNTGGGYH